MQLMLQPNPVVRTHYRGTADVILHDGICGNPSEFHSECYHFLEKQVSCVFELPLA